MENDSLNNTWNNQNSDTAIQKPQDIIKKAKQQRNGQYITIAVLSATLVILIAFTLYFANNIWNNFTLGMTLMISSLSFRVLLELISIRKKENQLVTLSNKAYKAYLKKHYRIRLNINYVITPICLILYIIGFMKLLPYFKQELSQGFYTYILVSGFISLAVIIGIIITSVKKENAFLKQLSI